MGEGHSREPHQAVGTDGERNGNDESVHEGTRNEDYYDRNTHGTAVVDLWHHQALYGLRNTVTACAWNCTDLLCRWTALPYVDVDELVFSLSILTCLASVDSCPS